MRVIALLALLSRAAEAKLSDYTLLPSTDVTPCIPPCVRTGGCGYDEPLPVCNISLIADACSATYGCVSFNSNGWLKGCGNVSCGITFEAEAGVDSYILTASGGMPPPPFPCNVTAVEDEHYPPEEAEEREEFGAAPSVLSTGASWALLGAPGGGTSVNVSVGQDAFGFMLMHVDAAASAVVVEQTFYRWGFLAFVSATDGEIARFRKGTGSPWAMRMPNWAYLAAQNCSYYATVYSNYTDSIAAFVVAETGGEATFLHAAKYLPPQRDYASIGAIYPYHKYSVSPDGRIKIADSDIYTPTDEASVTGPGVMVFDPRDYMPFWPTSNWTSVKSALVGSYLRVVSVIGYDEGSGNGFEQIAFAPASDPSAAAYVRLLATPSVNYSYYNVSAGVAAVSLSPSTFYAALLAEQSAWNATFATSVAYRLPGAEGARQVDTAAGALVASMSLYVGLQPNYGDGADYWSPQVDRGGSLPFQLIAVVQNLLDVGLVEAAGERLGWWMDNYLKPDGAISTGDWEDSCPDQFADALADYGEMQDIFVRTARMQLGYNAANGSTWLAAHIDAGARLMNFSYALRMEAVARGDVPGVNVTAGMVFGSPEHDTCHEPGFYYHNNAWLLRGMKEAGGFLAKVCPSLCPAHSAFGATLLAEAGRFSDDLTASLALSVTTRGGVPFFVPPIAQAVYPPFGSMIESTIAEYSNFRYFPELLGADVLSPALSNALQNFRESSQGTVSGITRWSDHLDDMPSSYYLAASLRDDRLERFFLLLYGHMANYQSRGTFTATEQLPIMPDENGVWRDYLWGYLEGGIDQCVPSIMLPAIATRWQMVFERYDEDTLYLARGAPRRWFDPSTGGFEVRRAATRFGTVDMVVANTNAPGGEDTTIHVTFTPHLGVPGVTDAPLIALRVRSSNARDVLVPSTIAVSGSATLIAVSAIESTLLLRIAGGAADFTVTASLTH